MSITIVATAASATANSYATLTEADSYFEAVSWFSSTWSGLTDAQKNARLVQATRAIDRLSFDGERYDDDQALEFPRDLTDQSTDDGEMPQKVKDAQCEMIMWQYQHIDSTTGDPDDRQIDEISLGKGDISIKYSSYRQANKNLAGGTPESVRALLQYWLISGGNIKLERA